MKLTVIGKAVNKLLKLPEIVAIETTIQETYERSFTWTCGGCFALAEAFTKAIPHAELWVIGEKEENDWASHHAVCKIGEYFYDGNGQNTAKQLLAPYKGKLVKLGKVKTWIDADPPDSLWYPEQEFVRNEEIKLITKSLKQLLTVPSEA